MSTPRQSTPTSMLASGSSLSSVVSGLVRAQIGSSLPPTVTDEDLDKHVAELILREAKKKAETYKQHGVHALVSNRDYTDSNAPRPNKRFLTSIIRSTDDHNKTVLRAQAQAAQDAKMQRVEQEKEERRRRAEEAVAARKKEMYGHASGSSSRRDREREGSMSRREKGRDRERDRDDERRRGSSRDKGKGRERDRDVTRSRRRESERDESSARRTRDRSRSPSKSQRRWGSRSRPKTDDTEGWDRWDGAQARRTGEQRRKVRDWATWNGEDHNADDLENSRRRSRSPDTVRRRTRSPSTSPRTARSPTPLMRSRRHALDDSSENEVGPQVKWDDRESERTRRRDTNSPPPSVSKRGRSPSPADSIPAKRSKHVRPSTHNRHRRSPSCSHPPPRGSPSPSYSPSSRARSVTPGPLPAPPSKMDKYFADSYDPRLDVAPLSAPSIPATGLISDAQFEGWDAMLALVKQRQADREERKMLERMGVLSKDKKEKDRVRKKKKGVEDAGKGTKEAAARWGEETSIMDIEYTKKGAVREWDLGKETPT